MTITVSPVRTRRQREEFLRLPWRLYAHDPAWIPNLLFLQRQVISTRQNPFFDHGEAELYVAYRDGRPAGRISAHVDRLHNEHHNENVAFFGFFEAEDDPAVASALIEAATAWARERGFSALRGPFNFTINEEVGVLVEGFEHPPYVGMTHSLPYYDALLKGAGCEKAMDLFAFLWEVKEPPARILPAVERARAVPGLRVRPVRMLHLHRDVRLLLDIFNDAWSENWGFVPATPREARKIAADLRLIAEPRIALIAELDGEPAGMIVAVPNLYEAVRDFRGYLNPWNALRLVWRLKVRGLESGRIMLFGVKKEFQRRRDLYGLPFLLLYELWRGSQGRRYRWGEESWVLETNKLMIAILPHWDARPYKRYRVYEKVV
jgi:GNAT superfamily N-acetyltransferase